MAHSGRIHELRVAGVPEAQRKAGKAMDHDGPSEELPPAEQADGKKAAKCRSGKHQPGKKRRSTHYSRGERGRTVTEQRKLLAKLQRLLKEKEAELDLRRRQVSRMWGELCQTNQELFMQKAKKGRTTSSKKP